MAYDLFTKETVFVDQSVNVLCNSIFNSITTSFTIPADGKFCVTGSVAKILQGGTAKDIQVVPFITDNDAIYNFCATEIPKQLRATAVKFTDRVQMNYNGVFVEFWKVADVGTVNTVTGILVQDPLNIPVNIK